MKCMVYPFNESFMPIMNVISAYRRNIEITNLVYPTSWHLNEINNLLSDDFNQCLMNADTVFILSCRGKPFMHNHIIERINYALNAGRTVICCELLTESELINLRKYLSTNKFIYLLNENISENISENRYYKRQDSIIVTIANLLDNMNDTVAICSLYSEYKKAGYSVEVVSTNPDTKLLGFNLFPIQYFKESIGHEKQILKLNKFFCELSDNSGADIILVQMPGGLMKYSDFCCDNFGIYSYMTAQALAVDYFILNIPVMASLDKQTYQELINTIRYRFGFHIDNVLLENIIVEDFNSMEDEKIHFKYIDNKTIDEIITEAKNNDIELLPLASRNTFTEIAEKSITVLSEQIEGI